MIKINMVEGGFQHDISCSAFNRPKHVEWVKDGSSNISFHIDNGLLFYTDKSKKNYGWLVETRSIVQDLISFIKNNLNFYKENYECIFTHDKELCNFDPLFKFSINASPWIQNRKIFEKTKDVSFIVSNKQGTPGYKFRLDYLEKVKNKVDCFGKGFANELPWIINYEGINDSGKILGLKDYHFSFAFENANYLGFFTEKITDCFATGTIPIYHGCQDIGDYFDINGIIIFNENLNLSELNSDLYKSKKKSIETNFKIASEMLTPEDYIYINYLK